MRIFMSFVVACATAAMAGSGAVLGRAPQEPGAGDYAWAPACKTCHEQIYEAWSGTKHARALARLSDAEQERECVGCHVTGGKNKISKDGKTVNAGIQCESCHGAAAAHAADPAVRTGLVRKPGAELCTGCHNDRSPSFRGFFYDAMWPLSHRVAK
jgi:predicted CXXCH cytochrome family protein